MDLPNLRPGDEPQPFDGHGAFHLGVGVSGHLACGFGAAGEGLEGVPIAQLCLGQHQQMLKAWENFPEGAFLKGGAWTLVFT